MTLPTNRWTYSDPADVKGYRRAVRNAALLGLISLASLYIVTFAASMVIGFAVSIISAASGGSAAEAQEKLREILRQDGVAIQVVQIISTVISMSVPFLVFVKLRGKKLRDYVSFAPVLPEKAPHVLIAGIALLYTASIVAGIFYAPLQSFFGVRIIDYPSHVPSSYMGIVLNFFAIAVFPPFFEEFAFRGVVLRELLPYGKTSAIVVSAVIFGALHCTPYGYFYAVMAGLIFGWIAVKTGSIFYTVIIHFVFNALSFGLTFLFDKYPDSAEVISQIYQTAVLAAGLGLLFYLIASKYQLRLGEADVHLEPAAYRRNFWHPLMIVFLVVTVALTALLNFEYVGF